MSEKVSEIKTGWMTWEEIEPFKNQLVELEQTLMIKYHYPDRYDGKEYCQNKVDKLKEYLHTGNTYFWGAICNGELIGYYWAFTTRFINKKRWCLSSLMIKEEYQHIGLGSMAIREGLKMAKVTACDEAATEYAYWNDRAAKAYREAGYEITRIEVVKRLDQDDKEQW